MMHIARLARGAERGSTLIGCGCLMALMLIVTADVGFRYLANRPFLWSHELITLYLTPALFFLTLSDSYRAGAQVKVDVLHAAFPPPLRRGADAIGILVSLLVFGLTIQGSLQRALESWRNDEVLAGAIPWPVWPSAMLVPLGCAMLVLRLLAGLGRLLLDPNSGNQDTTGDRVVGGFE